MEELTTIIKEFANLMITIDEIDSLIRYHESAAKYQDDCYRTQLEIANKEPLYTFGEHQTKEDWLRTSEEWKKGRDWHLERCEYWRKLR